MSEFWRPGFGSVKASGRAVLQELVESLVHYGPGDTGGNGLRGDDISAFGFLSSYCFVGFFHGYPLTSPIRSIVSSGVWFACDGSSGVSLALLDWGLLPRVLPTIVGAHLF